MASNGPIVSIHGRALGFDPQTGALWRNGKEGNGGDETVTAGSTGTNIPPRGTTTLPATAAASYTMDAPVAGVRAQLFATAATTKTVTLASGTFRTTAGSSFNRATLEVAGSVLELVGLSTSLYGVLNTLGTVNFTTA